MFNLKQYNFKNYNISLVIMVVILSSIGTFLEAGNWCYWRSFGCIYCFSY